MNNNVKLDELKLAVESYAEKRGGRIYAPINHPEFSSIPSQHGHERFDAIIPYIPKNSKTVLDIGSHWGYFAHRFEGMGFDVTAAENSKEYLYFLRSIRELCKAKFNVWDRSVFDMPEHKFDVVLALNIFHHFIKNEIIYSRFIKFLESLDCKLMAFQPHNPQEGQMIGSYKNYDNNEFVDLVCSKTGLRYVGQSAAFDGRPIFFLSK